MLVSTDVAAMGLDTDNLNMSLNIGIASIDDKHFTFTDNVPQAYQEQHGNSSSRQGVLVGMVYLLWTSRWFSPRKVKTDVRDIYM